MNRHFSFEFSAPRSPEATEKLLQVHDRLQVCHPDFFSVTYGAGGSTRENTHSLVKEIKNKTSLEPAAHLTCFGTSLNEIEKIADDYWSAGVKHLVALRGDVPKQQNTKKNDFKFATDLIKFLKSKYEFDITVSAYPEMHPDSKTKAQE